MTATVHSIGREQKLTVAHSMMKKWRIRHLAVLDGGLIVGVLSLVDALDELGWIAANGKDSEVRA